MTSIGTEDERLMFTLKVLDRLPRQGFVDDGPVGMNSDLGMLRLRFTQTLGDQAWLDRDVMAFEESLRMWIDSVERLVAEGKNHSATGFDNQICPHLRLNIQRQEWVSYSSIEGEKKENRYVFYEFFAGLASTYLLGSGGEWDAAPGMWIEVDGEILLRFVRTLRDEINREAG